MKSTLEEDVISITELMHQAPKIIQKIKKNRRPLLITQNGKAAMICMNVGEYERQLNRLALIEAVAAGEKAFKAGDFAEWKDFEKELGKM